MLDHNIPGCGPRITGSDHIGEDRVNSGGRIAVPTANKASHQIEQTMLAGNCGIELPG